MVEFEGIQYQTKAELIRFLHENRQLQRAQIIDALRGAGIRVYDSEVRRIVGGPIVPIRRVHANGARLAPRVAHPAMFPPINLDHWGNQPGGTWRLAPMVTQMINLNEGNFFGLTLQNTTHLEFHELRRLVERTIMQNVAAYTKQNQDDFLWATFLLIQTWGGSAARTHTAYMAGHRVEILPVYRAAVTGLLNENQDLIHRATAALNQLEGINRLGRSFATKHIAFWTGKGVKENGLPILDDVISKVLYNKPASRVNYQDYLNFMNLTATSAGVTVGYLERSLFAFARIFWTTRNTRTAIFIQPLQDETDLEVARRLAGNIEIVAEV